MPIADAAAAEQAADFLLPAWHDRTAGRPSLPPALRPADQAQAYAVQQALMRRLGPIGGWKVGAAGPAEPCTCAPMPQAGAHISPVRLPAAAWPARGVEAEIAVRLGHSLTPRPQPYTRDEVLAAIDTCHPLIEVVQSRFAQPQSEDQLSMLADFAAHGCFVLGPSVADWRERDFAAQLATLSFAGRTVAARTGNPGGDMIRMLQFLADEGACWAGGLMAGQVVTTGSWTGLLFPEIGEAVVASFPGLGEAEVMFAD
jgi:2-keto-4-pentenoate hydratase